MAMSDRRSDQEQMEKNLFRPAQLRRLKIWEEESQKRKEEMSAKERREFSKRIKQNIENTLAKHGIKKKDKIVSAKKK